MLLNSFLLIVTLLWLDVAPASEAEITTVLLSSYSTPDQLATLVDHTKDIGIEIKVEEVHWNQTERQITSLKFSVRFQEKDGSWRTPIDHDFKYNQLTEGALFFLQNGADSGPIQMMVHNEQFFEELAYLINPDQSNYLLSLIWD